LRPISTTSPPVGYQVIETPSDFPRFSEQRQQVGHPRRHAAEIRQQGGEGGVGLEDAAVGIGNHHRLGRLLHLPAHLVELVLGQQHAHRTELDDDVADRLAHQAGKGDVGIAPGIGDALDQLVPLRERAPR
jgi:hypothetical protein